MSDLWPESWWVTSDLVAVEVETGQPQQVWHVGDVRQLVHRQIQLVQTGHLIQPLDVTDEVMR